ncbi:MAG: Uma2 family endonuclease [Syntrophaceae bacterium]|nr:Uma2 family endonuclease [Syntrophaceae bacterium]
MKGQAFKIDEKFTYQDYFHLPDNGKRHQIIDGELYMVPAPVPYHQRILRNLGRILDQFVNENRAGEIFYSPCDVVLSDVDVVQPDIFFISQERLSIVQDKNIQGAPDLIVEILSPYSEKIDKISKVKLYARYGVKEYWIVNPEKKEVTVLNLKGSSYKSLGNFCFKDSFETKFLKGLTIKVSEIFPPQ